MRSEGLRWLMRGGQMGPFAGILRWNTLFIYGALYSDRESELTGAAACGQQSMERDGTGLNGGASLLAESDVSVGRCLPGGG